MKKKILFYFISMFLFSISLVSAIGIWKNRQLYFKEHIVSMGNIYSNLEYYCADWKRMAEGLMSDEEYNNFIYQNPETYYYVTDNDTGEVFSNLPEDTDYETFLAKPGILRYAYINPSQQIQTGADGSQIMVKNAEYQGYESIEEKHTGTILVDMERVDTNLILGSIGTSIRSFYKQRWILFGETAIFGITLSAGILLMILRGKKALVGSIGWMHRIKLDIQLLGILMSAAAFFFLLPRYSRYATVFGSMTERIILYGCLILFSFIFLSMTVLLAVRVYFFRSNQKLWLQSWENCLIRLLPVGITAFILLLCWYGIIIMNFFDLMIIQRYMGTTSINPGIFIIHIAIILSVSLSLQKISNIKQQYQREILAGALKIADGHPETEVPVIGSSEQARTAEAINQIRTGYIRSLEEQKKSERLKYELVTNISHDLRTPLTLTLNYIGLLRREERSKEQQHYIDQAENQAKKINLLIDDLFELSRLESGNIELKTEEADLFFMWRQMQQEYRDQLSGRNLELVVESPRDRLILPCDSAQIWRVFDNLLQNAIKYSLENTRIYVCLLEAEDNDEIQVQVKNITAERLTFDPEELFLRFKRGNEARDTEGSGLGLAIARSIVALHGGSIRIEIEGDMFKVLITFKKR